MQRGLGKSTWVRHHNLSCYSLPVDIVISCTCMFAACVFFVGKGGGSVQFRRPVMSSLRPHGLQHARLPCTSPSSRRCSNSCPLSRWCHPTISSTVVPFSCLQYFSASGSFLMNWVFASVGQSIGASASTSVLPMNVQGWFSLGLIGSISLLSKGLSRVFTSTTVWRNIDSSALSVFYCASLTYIQDYWKNHSFDYTDLCRQSNVSAFQYTV